MPGAARSAGSRKVEPRRRKRSPSDQRRKARRALAQALGTSAEIQGKARQRQRSRAEGEANRAASLDTDLFELYGRLGADKRQAAETGVVSTGGGFAGKTAAVFR